MDAIELAPASRQSDEVVYKIPDYRIDETFDANEARAMRETTPEHVARIGGDKLRPIFESGEGVRLAVLDTGISKAHIQRGELEIVEAKDFTSSRYGHDDANGHGTHCSGIICAENNESGTSSILPECLHYSGKVLGDSGSGGDRGLAAGIDWAVSKQVDIISMSWGGGYSQRVHEALKRAVAAGITCVAAAGNSGNRGTIYPARLNDVCISVAAVNFSDQLANFSSRGADVDAADDGVNVYSTFRGGTYARLSGTSMATPNLAAKIGALKALEIKHLGKPVKRTPAEMITFLRRWAVDRGPSGHDRGYGWGTVTTSFPQMITEYDEELSGGGGEPPPDDFEPIRVQVKKDIPAGEYLFTKKE